MISDVLHDAIAEIERYQTDQTFAAAYSDPALAAEIERVKAAMVALRERLDAPPIQYVRRTCRQCGEEYEASKGRDDGFCTDSCMKQNADELDGA